MLAERSLGKRAARRALLVALGGASMGPDDVGSVEAHGTGTALGDPTEGGALAAVHGWMERPTALVLGAAKASVGHTEVAIDALKLITSFVRISQDKSFLDQHI